MTQQIVGLEAYRDDPEYTSPEMEPGHGEDIGPEPTPERAAAAASGFTIGIAGGALAGSAIIRDIEDEKAELAPHHV